MILKMENKSDPTVVWLVNKDSRRSITGSLLPVFEQPCWCAHAHAYPWLEEHKSRLLSFLNVFLPLEICEHEVWPFLMNHPKCFENAQELFHVVHPDWQLPPSSEGLKKRFLLDHNMGIFTSDLEILLPHMLFVFDPLVCLCSGQPSVNLDMLPQCFIHDDNPTEILRNRKAQIMYHHSQTNEYPPGWQGFDDLLIHDAGPQMERKPEHKLLMNSRSNRLKNWLLQPVPSLRRMLDYLIIYQCTYYEEQQAYGHCKQHFSSFHEFQTVISDKAKAHVIVMNPRNSAERHWSFDVPTLLPPFRISRGMWNFVREVPPHFIDYSRIKWK